MNFLIKKYNKNIFWITLFIIIAFFALIFSHTYPPFIAGFLLAYIFVPLIDLLSKYINRAFLSICFTLTLICTFIMALSSVLPKLTSYLLEIISNSPAYCHEFVSLMKTLEIPVSKELIDTVITEVQKYFDQRFMILASILGKIASQKTTILNVLTSLTTFPIAFFYFLKDWNRMSRAAYRIIPVRQKTNFLEITVLIRETLKNFFKGQFCIVIILSAYYSFFLYVIHIDNPVRVGILSGFASFIPFIGAMFSCFLVIFFNAKVFSITTFCFVLLIYTLGQLLEGYVLAPRFIGHRMGLHPLWILFSFLAGLELGGVIGIFLALPLASVIRSLAAFWASKFYESPQYKQ